MASHRRKQSLGFFSVAQEVAHRCNRDRITTEAASIAFYFFLSFFPLILSLFALTGLIGREAAFDWIMNELLVALPNEASALIGEFVFQVTSSRSASALSIGLVLSFWTASNIFAVLADGLNKAYKAKRRRQWWKRRALALGLLLVLAVAMIILAVSVLAGPAIAKVLQVDNPFGSLTWPLTLLMAVLMMWLTYYWLPNHDQSRSKRWILVGALVGTVLWVAATLLFRWFLSYTPRFSAIYGLVGGIAAFLIWLFLTALCILVGGEVAAAMERRALAKRRLRQPAETAPPVDQMDVVGH